MRTTLSTMNKKILNNLNSLTNDLNRINESISSERQMSTPSDNPANLVAALGLRTSLAEIKQYSTNLTYGSSFIDASEAALQQMKEGLTRARVVALNAINGAINSDNRANMAKEISNIFDQTVTLANTQINGKFIFAGYRTAGYNEIEPTPFIADQADGYRVTGQNLATEPASLTGTVDGTVGIAAGDLTINGTAIGAIAAGAAQNGLYMATAADAVTQINAAATGVTASLTTLYAGLNATADTVDAVDTVFSFDVNGVNVSVTVPDGSTADVVASLTVAAINGAAGLTGVSASVGDGTNGGDNTNTTVVLRNVLSGDDSDITIANYVAGPGDATSGLGNFTQGADAAHNTGQISLTSNETFVLASPNNLADDTVLQTLGLDGGGLGFADEAGDGQLVYGYRLAAGDLEINGIPIGASTDDGFSTIYADASAAAKANAINALSDQTGVSAVITPVYRLAEGRVEAGFMDSGDLIINGIDIFGAPTAIAEGDSDNVLLDAINAKQDQTGVVATRNSGGQILLTPVVEQAGMNLHIETSANGETVTHLNGGTPVEPQSKVYFGSVQLRSDHKFTVETSPTVPSSYEPGLASIGLAGGTSVTGEAGDTAGDGKLTVSSVMDQAGNVRYVGDKENDIAIKVGTASTLDISKNGQSGVKDTGIFDALKDLENFLLGDGYTAFHSLNQATDTTATLDSGDTGLDRADELVTGNFTVTVTDKATDPPRDLAVSISVDPAVDTLDEVAKKIDGVPGITAQWDSDGYLQVSVDDPDRYTVNMEDHSSNFLEIIGLRQEDIQGQALGSSLTAIDDAIQQLNNNISDFGARANRITIQNQIYDNLELTTSSSLSEAQDTDVLEAVMNLTSKQTAYQAALSAASRTLQLSLVDYL